MRPKLYHVSFQAIDKFGLIVPSGGILYEDQVTPRICLSTRVRDCLNAMPGGGIALRGLLAGAKYKQSKAVLHAYVCFPLEEPEGTFLEPETLMMCHGVLDAEANSEHWAIRVPKMAHRTIEVREASFVEMEDLVGHLGVYVEALNFDTCDESSNWAEDILEMEQLHLSTTSARGIAGLFDEMCVGGIKDE